MLDYAVYIGRFQPFHVGHQSVLKFALRYARKVIILVGSANLHASPKDPFPFEFRKQLITYSAREVDSSERIADIRPVNDIPYNDTAWATQVRDIVKQVTNGAPNDKIGIVGYEKDDSSYYLSIFKEWEKLAVPAQFGTFDATGIRSQYFIPSPVISEFLASDVRKALRDFAFTPEFKWLVNEAKFLVDYDAEWGQGPFVTADAVATQAGRILLVRRKFPPYAGALALPGGFLNKPERIIDAAVRELKEETRISDQYGEIPHGKLKSFITGSEIFDAPKRDPRARIITQAFRFEFPDTKDPYWVQGSDDAEHAQWYNLSDLDPRDFMADHWFIIQKMTGIAWK